MVVIAKQNKITCQVGYTHSFISQYKSLNYNDSNIKKLTIMNRLNKEQLEFMNGYVPANIHDIYEYATGGGIHIKKSHEGRFTAYKKRTGKTTEEALHSPDPHVRQMANFARNASHWKHQEGGAAGGQDQIMQIIQAYASSKGVDPNQLIAEIQKMSPDQQKKTLQKMYQDVAGNQMQEGGPAPQPGGPEPNGVQEYPQGQEPQGGQQDPQQLIQAVQQELKQGAKPEQVITELLQEQIDPQIIVQIFVQLGMPEQEVVQDIQSIMGQSQEGGNPQEQENPQEQMQEQGQEEPQGPPMAFGGTPRFDWGGGAFENYNHYVAPGVVDDNNFNSNMLRTNSWSDPSVSTLPYLSAVSNNPVTGFATAVAGALSAGSGALAGYKGLMHNQRKAQYNKQYIHDANETSGNIPVELNLKPAQSTNDAWNSYGKPQGNALWNKYNPATVDPYKQNTYGNWKPGMQIGGEYAIDSSSNPLVVPTSGSYPTSYQNLPDNMQPMKVARVDATGKPLTRNVIAANQQEYNRQRNVQPEYDTLNRMFGWMSTNNASEQDWNRYNEKRNSGPNVGLEGMEGPGTKKGGYCGSAAALQQRLNGKEYGGSHYELPHAQSGLNYYDMNNPYFSNNPGPTYTGDTSKNVVSLTDAQVADDKGGYAYPQFAPNNNKANINNKTLNISGMQIADNALNGLGMVQKYATDVEARKLRNAYNNHAKQVGNTMYSTPFNNPNPYGEYTTNSGKFKPNMGVATQDIGTGSYAKYGGSTKYQKGGEYHVTHDELLQLMRNGAEVEFL